MAEQETSGSEYLLQEKQQPGGFAASPPQQQQPTIQPQSIKKDTIAPHSYLALSICVAIFCGIFNPFTLTCTIPAIIVSAMVSDIVDKSKFNELTT